ncbi:unnamed protein product [Blepharisma stoltei]|uniref:Uncharacterized protein n=1 Tax=Blepharisma stoltei TaxID=1481888 RepID=A0AAU9IV65_9CILI|nr:unnamed protein product [Blepharisma stoltei]
MKSQDCKEARDARKKLWVERLTYLNGRLQALAWVAGAVAVLYYTNFFYVAWENEMVNRFFFALTLITFGIYSSMIIYASFFLPTYEPVEVTAPRLIPVATAIGVLCFICAHIAFWPVWGLLTPGILITLMIGYLMAGSFLPKSSLGSVLFLGLFIGAAITSRYIPHKGLLH